jgi:membrane-associated protease RseP (regulator of RpoE activity)
MREIDEPIVLPAPTAWPFVTAFGLALLFAGLVTHAAVSLAGLATLACGAIGWWREVLPAERHEEVSVESRDAVPIQASPRIVEYLTVGAGGHRARIPVEIHPYSAGVKGGIVGAVAMAAVAVTYGLLSQHSLWYVVNLLAAGVVPSLASADLDRLRAFSGVGLALGFVLHALLSTLVGVLYAVLLPMFPRKAGLWSGLITPLVWSGLVSATLGVVNPTLNTRIDWTWFVASQVAFGLTCGFVVARTHRIETMQSWALERRAGLEGGHRSADQGREP